MSISEEQLGFVKGNSTIGAVCALTQLQERHREDSKTYTVCSLIWKKHTTDRVPRDIGACETRGAITCM